MIEIPEAAETPPASTALPVLGRGMREQVVQPEWQRHVTATFSEAAARRDGGGVASDNEVM